MLCTFHNLVFEFVKFDYTWIKTIGLTKLLIIIYIFAAKSKVWVCLTPSKRERLPSKLGSCGTTFGFLLLPAFVRGINPSLLAPPTHRSSTCSLISDAWPLSFSRCSSICSRLQPVSPASRDLSSSSLHLSGSLCSLRFWIWLLLSWFSWK